MDLKQAIAHYQHLIQGGIADAVKEAHQELHQACIARFPLIAIQAIRAASGSENLVADEVIHDWVSTFASNLSQLYSTYSLDELPETRISEPLILAGGPVTADDIEQWVRAGAEGSDDDAYGKVFDGRDIGSVEEIVRKMQGILLFASPPAASHSKAREKFLPLIAQFKGNQEARAVGEWIEKNGPGIVLKAWVQFVTREWPIIACKHLAEVL